MYIGKDIYRQIYMYIHFNDIAFRKTGKKIELALYSILHLFASLNISGLYLCIWCPQAIATNTLWGFFLMPWNASGTF